LKRREDSGLAIDSVDEQRDAGAIRFELLWDRVAVLAQEIEDVGATEAEVASGGTEVTWGRRKRRWRPGVRKWVICPRSAQLWMVLRSTWQKRAICDAVKRPSDFCASATIPLG